MPIGKKRLKVSLSNDVSDQLNWLMEEEKR